MTRSTALCEKRQAQILEAAMAVFTRVGMGRARMEDIAREAGLSKGALYLYFESKDALIVQLVEQLFSDYVNAVKENAQGEGPVTARLCALADALTAYAETFTETWSVIYEIFAWAIREASVHRIVEAYYRASREVIAALIQEGIAQGEFRPVDPEEIAVQIIALHEGVLQLQAFFGAAADWRTLMLRGIEFIIEALRPLPQMEAPQMEA